MDIFTKLYRNHVRVIRFILSGVIVAFVALLSLYVLTDLLHFWYLFSSVASFLISIIVNFFLQHYWTFDDAVNENIASKAGLFFANALLNLSLNTVLMYVFVDVFSVWYMLAQTIVMAGLSIMNYLIYRYYIFKPRLISE